MQSSLAIRPATRDDVPQLAELAESSDQSASWGAGKYLDRISNPSGIVLIADCKGERVGFGVARVVAPECEVENVVIAARYRRQGLGRALLIRVLEACRTRNCSSAWLEVRESNRAARSLYEGMGFSEVARRPGYYRDPKEDALILRISL